MNKEKFNIPMPDEGAIQLQIEKIVAMSIKEKKTFFSYVKSMVQQVGLRHLFSDRMELTFILFTVIALLSVFIILPARAHIQGVYAMIFLISPFVFLVFSFYTYVFKTQNATYEVEMACKYNVYQIIAFRMLTFSIVAILVNTVAIAFIAMRFEDIQFLRAFMISITALFIFSIVFLYALMKRRSPVIVAITVAGWAIGNLLLRFVYNKLYSDMLIHMPLVIYALVLMGCLSVYMSYVNKLIHYKETEGAF